MKVYFRVDANQEISGGHVSRCLSLAGAFKDAGYEVVFASSDDAPTQIISSAGFCHVVLGCDWHDLGSDNGALRGFLEKECDPLLIVDSYRVNRRFVENMAECSKVCYLGSRSGYLGPLSAIINYSTAIDRAAYEAAYRDSGTVLLLGPRYAPLRRQFQELEQIDVSCRVKRVLVSTGGTDPLGMAMLITEAVVSAASEYALEEVVVLVGSMSNAREALTRRFSGDRHVRLVSGVSDMAELMRSCNLAVSANGTTVYELAACGVPAITFAISEEQRASGEGMSNLGAVAYCGCAADGVEKCLASIEEAVGLCCRDAQLRRSLQGCANAMTDGNGAMRVVSELRSALEF